MAHTVVLREPDVPFDRVPAIASALADVTGMPQLDAMQRVKRFEGVLFEGPDAGIAERLAETLRRLGVDAATAPAEAAARYKRRIMVRRAECTDAGLRVEVAAGRWQTAGWKTIRAGSLTQYREPLGTVANRGHRRFIASLTAGLGLTLGVAAGPSLFEWARDAATARDSIGRIGKTETFVLDLFAEPGGTLRIDARRFHYGYLGDRMHGRCELNFHSLLGDIVARARGAVFAPAVQTFLTGKLSGERALTDLHDFDVFNRWFLLAAAAFKPK